jgi:hypothetical protein
MEYLVGDSGFPIYLYFIFMNILFVCMAKVVVVIENFSHYWYSQSN